MVMNHREVSWKSLGRAHVQRWRLLLLLPLLLVAFGCGGPEADHADQPVGTPLPADLVGPWKTILSYVPAYYTGIAGTSDFTGSLGITIKFAADGSYSFELDTAMTYFNGNCFRNTGWNEVGKVSLAGSEMTFTSTHATSTRLDSCGKAELLDPAPTGSATYTMSREQDRNGAPLLRLRLPSGEDLVLGR
jgi:hypothetical protein